MKDMRFVLAASMLARMRGLLGTDASWGNGETTLVLIPCKSVHTFGMRYALDIALANKNGVVLDSYRNVQPGHLLSCRGAHLTLERPAQSTPWFEPGSSILLSGNLD